MGHSDVSPCQIASSVGRRLGLLSIVVPCKDEEAVLKTTHAELVKCVEEFCNWFEVIYVDDGSRDSTFELLCGLQSCDARVRVVQLSRNFGHQVAVTAGLDHASGDVVAVIDADLQDPPGVISTMLNQWLSGYDVVYGLRVQRDGESLFKRWTAKVFYRVLARLSATPIAVDTGDFRLMDRKVVDALLSMPERDRFLRGMVSWLGFRQIAVPYRRAPRYAGQTKYPLLKMLRLAIDGITSFSVFPLKMAGWLGFFASVLSFFLMAYAVLLHVFTKRWVTGWTSIFIAVLFMGGVQLVCLGIIGEYVGRIYCETKHRPLYLVQTLLGFVVESNPRKPMRATAGSAVS